ncbi:MAG: flagellar motor switch protein FliN [Planctomycetes bacterium]|nr:flagellar motor switch protein FliN [Planctomycetota bacterium]MCB9920454.1 flagellar motor switch protein FliN [Planctomycetota bacterium]
MTGTETRETIEAAAASASDPEIVARRVGFPELGPSGDPMERQNLDLLLDVQIPVTVEVGRARLALDEILDLGPGSVVSLDKKAAEPLDLRVNGKLVARGEVVMVDDCYGLRITQIVDQKHRIDSLRG